MKLKLSLILLALFLLLPHPAHAHHASDYHFHRDEGFVNVKVVNQIGPEAEGFMLQALVVWNWTTSVRFQYVYGGPARCGDGNDGRPTPNHREIVVCWNELGLHGGLSTPIDVERPHINSWTIWIDPNNVPGRQARGLMLVHELGHTLGLDHNQREPHSVMWDRALGFSPTAHDYQEANNLNAHQH